MPQPFERDLLGEQLDAARDGIPASVSQRLFLNLPEASLDVALAATIEAKASTKVNIWQGLFARSAANAASQPTAGAPAPTPEVVATAAAATRLQAIERGHLLRRHQAEQANAAAKIEAAARASG